MNRAFLPTLACFAVAPVWAADAIEPLDLKPGYWQITLVVRTHGSPPLAPEVLSKLTAEQRSRIESSAREAAQGPRVSVKRNCLDRRELQQPLMLTFGSEAQGCRQTVTSATRFKQEIRVDCDKGAHGGGNIRIDVSDPENATVSSDWSGTDGTHSLKMSSTATLKWLGSVCESSLPTASRTAAPPASSAPRAAPPHPAPQPPSQTDPPKEDAVYEYKLGKQQTDKSDFWGALRSFNRAIELDPNRAASYNARGYVYLRLHQFANALVEFSTAIRLRPDYANAYRNRAIARQHMGEQQGAADDNRKATELEKRP